MDTLEPHLANSLGEKSRRLGKSEYVTHPGVGVADEVILLPSETTEMRVVETHPCLIRPRKRLRVESPEARLNHGVELSELRCRHGWVVLHGEVRNHLAETSSLKTVHDSNTTSLLTSTSSTAETVNVLGTVGRESDLDDARHIRVVHTTGGHVTGEKELVTSITELGTDLVAVSLALA